MPQIAGASLEDRLSLWLFVMNWTHAGVVGFGHFWSLAVEEQFYLCWPFLTFWLPARRFLWACAGIALGSLLLRSAMSALGVDAWTLYTNTLCRMDALALGAGGACILRLPDLRDGLRRRLAPVSVLALMLLFAGFAATRGYDIDSPVTETIGYSVLAVCCAVFVTGVALVDPLERTWITALLRWRVLRACGRYSYGMYMFHQLIHKLLGTPFMRLVFGRRPGAVAVFAYSAVIGLVSFALAFASYHLLEKRFLGLKRHFRPRWAAGVPQPPPIGA